MSLASDFNPMGASYSDLYKFTERARREEPVFFWDQYKVWVVSRYEDCLKVLSDTRFSNDGNLGIMNASYCPEAREILSRGINWNETPQVNALEGAHHTRLRGVMQKILTPARFRAMQPTVRRMVNELIDEFIDKGQCDFVEDFTYPLPVKVIFDVIGFKPEEENLPQLQIWSDDMFRLWLVPMSPEDQIRCARHAVQYQDYMRAKIADRRANPRDDLLSEFVRQLDAGEGQLSEDELIILFPMNLIGAGHETTKAALANALYQLLSVPERWQSVIADPATLPSVVEECLRLDSSVFGWYRTATEDVELGGKTIRKGEPLIALLGSANHDPDKYADAESFCPHKRGERSGQLAFSTGRHFCMGAPLARMEMIVALEELARRLPNLRLAKNAQIEYDPSVAVRALKHLRIEWDPPAAKQ